MSRTPVVLCILDGWGIGADPASSAPAQANVPNFNRLWASCPHSTLTTFGPEVGLPTGQMGNSEVGHTNIGAGRVVAMDLGAIDLAIEDGTFHLDPPGEDTPVRSTNYTAVLQKNDAGAWQIASTRDLKDVTEAGGQLSALAENLKGDWTCQKDGMRMDFAFGWDDTGKFLIGEMLTTTDDAEPQTTTMRIGWDGSRKTITWWTFDSGGGFAKGDWTPDDNGWIIRTEGSSANGEATSGV